MNLFFKPVRHFKSQTFFRITYYGQMSSKFLRLWLVVAVTHIPAAPQAFKLENQLVSAGRFVK